MKVYILCGRGDNIPDCLRDAKPKGLIDICGVPLISFVLRGLFHTLPDAHARLVVEEEEREAYEAYIRESWLSEKDRLEVVVQEGDYGYTGTTLADIHGDEDDDLLILPCDLIGHLDYKAFIESARRERCAGVVMKATSAIPDKVYPASWMEGVGYKDIVTCGEDGLAYFGNYEEGVKSIKAPLENVDIAHLHVKVSDIHVYFIRGRLLYRLSASEHLEFWEEEMQVPAMQNLNQDILPFIVAMQHSNLLPLLQKDDWKGLISKLAASDEQVNNSYKAPVTLFRADEDQVLIRCQSQAAFFFIINTLTHPATDILERTLPRHLHVKLQPSQCKEIRNTYCKDSASVQVGKKTNCARSFLMGSATIGDACKLQECIILPGAVVGKGCKLTRCLLGPGVSVSPNTVLLNECVDPKVETSV